MIVYHRTNHADAILSHGFRDGEGTYLTERVWRGVWFSDRPLDANEGAYGDTVLFVEIPDDVVADRPSDSDSHAVNEAKADALGADGCGRTPHPPNNLVSHDC